MPQLDISAYRGAITFKGEQYHFRAATRDDAGELAEMYAEVSINKNNYLKKLNPSPVDFTKTGGMFIIQNKASIIAEMKTGRSFFGLIERSDGAAVAMLWVSLDDPAFKAYRGPDSETLMYAREIIVRRNPLPHPTAIVFYTIFKALRDMGYTHSIGEVYNILQYRDAVDARSCAMLNKRSFRAMMNVGAIHLGANPVREAVVPEIPLTVLIEPLIVYFDYAAIIPALKKKLDDSGIITTFSGGF